MIDIMHKNTKKNWHKIWRKVSFKVGNIGVSSKNKVKIGGGKKFYDKIRDERSRDKGDRWK